MKTKSMLKIEFCNGCRSGGKPGWLADSGPPKFQRLCPTCLENQCKVCGFIARAAHDRGLMRAAHGVCPTCMATYKSVMEIVALHQVTVPAGSHT